MRGETLVGGLAAHDERVSIHSPHTRGDRPVRQDAGGNRHFNPLPSHEGRLQILPQPTWQNDFNPLPSYEGRHGRTRLSFSSSTFQSTPLTRGETELDLTEFFGEPISIHSPHTRGDHGGRGKHDGGNKFQSTPLIRGETAALRPSDHGRPISIHSPHARGDPLIGARPFFMQISIHSPHARGDKKIICCRFLDRISIHSPHTRGDSTLTRRTWTG